MAMTAHHAVLTVKVVEIMVAPKIDYSDRDERLQFVIYRFHCKYPSCGGCGSCHLPGGIPAVEYFNDYIEGRVEFVTIVSKIWGY